MADVEKSVEIIFGAVDNTGTKIEGIGNRIEDMAGGAQRAVAPLASASDMVLKLEGAILAVGAAEVGFAAKEAASFETGVTNISKTTGIAGEDLDRLSREIQDLAIQTGLSTERLTEIGAAAGQLGITGTDNILAFIDTIAKLGESSDIAGEAAAQSLGRILAVTGESASEIGKLGDVLVALGNNFEATESQIVNASTEIARSASGFGLASEEVTALGGAIAATGARAAGAGTAIGRTFRALEEAIAGGGEEMQRLVELTGLSADQLRTTFEEDALQVFQAFLKGVSDSGERTASVLDEFGLATEETIKALGPLIDQNDKLAQAIRTANTAVGEGVALEEEFANRLDTVEQQAKRTGQAFSVAAQRVGSEYAEGTNQALQATTGLLDAFVQVVGEGTALDEVLNYIDSTLKGLAGELDGIAQALPEALDLIDPQPMIDALENLRGSITGLFDGLDLSKPEDLAEALQLVMDGVAGLTNVTAGIVEALEPLFDGLVAAADGATELDSDIQELAGNLLGAGKAIEVVAGFLSSGGGLLVGLGLTAQAASGLGTTFNGLKGATSSLAGAMGSAGLAGALKTAGVGVSALMGYQLGSWLYENSEATRDAAQGFWALIDSMVDFTGTQDSAAQSQDALAEKVRVLKEITGDASITLDNYTQKFGEHNDRVMEVAGSTGELEGVTNDAASAARDFWGHLVDGSGDAKDGVAGVSDELGNILVPSIYDAGSAFGQMGDAGEQAGGKSKTGAELAREEIQRLGLGAEGTGESLGSMGESGADGLEKTAVEAQKAHNELLKIQTDFAGRVIESYVELDTSRLENATSRIESTMGGLENVVDSTGQTISSLWDTYAQAPTDSPMAGLESQIASENRARQESIDLIQAQAHQSMAYANEVGQGGLEVEKIRRLIESAGTEFDAGLIPSVDQFGQSVGQAAERTGQIGEEADRSTDSINQTEGAAEGLKGTLGEYAARVYESKVTLDISQAEAATARFQSSMEGITGTVQSTGSVLDSLFGNYTSTDDPFKAMSLSGAIQQEQDRRDDALRLQEDLVRSQMRYYEAKTDQLESGGSEITVNADGLEPELEAFMWRIIERVQIRASQEEAEFLIGWGG